MKNCDCFPKLQNWTQFSPIMQIIAKLPHSKSCSKKGIKTQYTTSFEGRWKPKNLSDAKRRGLSNFWSKSALSLPFERDLALTCVGENYNFVNITLLFGQ